MDLWDPRERKIEKARLALEEKKPSSTHSHSPGNLITITHNFRYQVDLIATLTWRNSANSLAFLSVH